MGFNFDEIVDRSAASCTYSSKWERYSGRFAEFDIDEENSLPMWVADMDFETASPTSSELTHTTHPGSKCIQKHRGLLFSELHPGSPAPFQNPYPPPTSEAHSRQRPILQTEFHAG